MKNLLFASLLFVTAATAEDNWPQFRGPNGNGISTAKQLPLNWNEKQNIKWKTPIHDRAWSCPVIWGNQLWMTTATEDGTKLFAICVDRESGKMVRDIKLFDVANPQFAHKFNTYGSPTPIIEEGRVYITFGSPGTACLDTATGEVLWTRRDFVCNHFRGAGSSPVIWGDSLIMNFDGSDYQFVVALDKKTGKTLWRTERSIDFQDLTPDGKVQADGDFRKAYSTPRLARFGGEEILISLGSKALYAYNPATGRDLWRAEDRKSHSGSATPVFDDELIYACTGFPKGQLIALRPSGSGVLADSNVVWRVNRNVPNKPSMLLVNGLLFMIDDGGIASCLEAKTGADVWRERIAGNYSASPLWAEGNIYLFSEEGKTTVIEAGRQFKVKATNVLDDGFMASPAVSGKALFLRTRTHLYRVENSSLVAN